MVDPEIVAMLGVADSSDELLDPVMDVLGSELGLPVVECMPGSTVIFLGSVTVTVELLYTVTVPVIAI